jgi:hypothetical protein
MVQTEQLLLVVSEPDKESQCIRKWLSALIPSAIP